MGNGNGGVIAFEKGAESLVDKGFGFGIEGGCCYLVSVCWSPGLESATGITFI